MNKKQVLQKPKLNTIDYTLVITACIKPTQFATKVKRNDPTERFEDYKQALRKWLNHKDERIKHIVFAENSGYPLKELELMVEQENRYNRGFTFFKKLSNEVPIGIHYGFSELELLDELVSQEKIPTSFFIKATGRTYFPKLSNLINKLSDDYLFVADSRKLKLINYSKNYILSNLFISNLSFYKKYIWGQRFSMEPGVNSHFEQLLQKQISSLPILDKNKCVLRFPINVDPQGYGAHWNTNYQSPKKILYAWLRSIVRKLIPSWYI